MSVYYDFYAGKLNKDNTLKILGPFVLDDKDEFELIPIVSRSSSFIDVDKLNSFCLSVNSEMLSDEEIRKISEEAKFNDGTFYYLFYEDVCSHASNGLVRGYATLEQIADAIECDYDLLCDWMYPILPAEVVSEMVPEERKKYGQIAYIDTLSIGYLCKQLVSCTSPWGYGVSKDEFCFILRIY